MEKDNLNGMTEIPKFGSGMENLCFLYYNGTPCLVIVNLMS